MCANRVVGHELVGDLFRERRIEVATNVLGGKLADHVVGIGRPEGSLLILIDLRPVLGRADPGDGDAA